MGESLPSQLVVVRRVVLLLCTWIPFPASVLWFQKELPGGACAHSCPQRLLPSFQAGIPSHLCQDAFPQCPCSTLVFSVLGALVTHSLVLWLFMYLACLSP